jgi:hypothetical protein
LRFWYAPRLLSARSFVMRHATVCTMACPRVNLTVPFVQKDAARALGAKWDKDNKTWYADRPFPLLCLSDDAGDVPRRHWLNVYFGRHKRAKDLGARWDPAFMSWYAPSAQVWREVVASGAAAEGNDRWFSFMESLEDDPPAQQQQQQAHGDAFMFDLGVLADDM